MRHDRSHLRFSFKRMNLSRLNFTLKWAPVNCLNGDFNPSAQPAAWAGPENTKMHIGDSIKAISLFARSARRDARVARIGLPPASVEGKSYIGSIAFIPPLPHTHVTRLKNKNQPRPPPSCTHPTVAQIKQNTINFSYARRHKYLKVPFVLFREGVAQGVLL